MLKLPSVILSLLSGLLLYAACPTSPFTFLIFVAFIPLLYLERRGIRRKQFFGWVYLTMLIWNVAATWWVWNASAPGSIAAFIANSLLMCLPWLGFHWVRARAGDRLGYLSLIAFWLSFEYLHLQNWGLSWPWLTLGNVFAARPTWIQWYCFTGTSGGSLWILVINILLFRLFWDWRAKRYHFRGTAAVLLCPFFLSLAAHYFAGPTVMASPNGENNVVIVQPNIDPYEKISTGTIDAQLQKLLRLSASAVDTNTLLLVWPETAVYSEYGFLEDSLRQNFFLNPLWDFLRRHPRLNLLTGVESGRIFKAKHSATAFRIPNTDNYYEGYNAAVLMDSLGPVQFYHKSKLVPGVETLPPYLHFLDSWFEKFGGTTAGYTGQDDRTVLAENGHYYRIAPGVCFESIYGEFMSRYMANGAGVIAIITNDGWWGNTPGYRQHESYARLRAIENRRYVLRSANTGVSCIIDPWGNIIDYRPWDTTAVIKRSVPMCGGLTLYDRFGDLISKIALVVAAFLLAYTIFKRIRRG